MVHTYPGAQAERGRPVSVHPGRHPAGLGPSHLGQVRTPQPGRALPSRPRPQGWRSTVPRPGAVEALACGPGSEPLIRRWQLSREPFNVVRWYFSGFFSEGKS